jgi:hypothetical protein
MDKPLGNQVQGFFVVYKKPRFKRLSLYVLNTKIKVYGLLTFSYLISIIPINRGGLR